MTDIILLDGSIGQELVKRSDDPPTPLWSTTVMRDHPDLVTDLHAEYFAAGATVASTNTYPVLPDRLAGTDLEDAFEALLTTAATRAVAARDAHGSGRVAGALGPLGASYRTDFSHSPDEARALYAGVIAALEPHVDLFMAETVSSLAQLRNVTHALRADTAKTAWIACSVDDDDGTRLRSGEPLADIAPLIAHDQIGAVLVNCSRPEAVSTAMPILVSMGKPFGGFANGFTEISAAFLEDRPTVDALSQRADLDPAAYGAFAMDWVARGATIVGGCCEVGPAHIAHLAGLLRAAGHRLV